ncbi:MAG: NADH-quinone oxidoreductase subunit L [Bdellovibrionales bacterium]
MSNEFLIALLIQAPLVGFIVNGVRFRSNNYKLAGGIASAAIGISLLCSIALVTRLMGMEPLQRVINAKFATWMSAGSFTADIAFSVDPISAIMILVITGVGLLIHIFSIGYMSHDERPTKYFAYLNFFIFNMLLLVLGDNLLLMFVGWEGVGLCSYLLIGFWFTDSDKAAAGMKAFITNRIGDAGFLLGIFYLFYAFGSVNFAELNALAPSAPIHDWSNPIVLACLFLFIGACGKSAQIPLYVWLPDAMAGPTPVSALIHAATMVTAGVYMIVRLNGVFIVAPDVMMIIAIVGALTALIAASIGMTQWDIKKVLAYSTVSQLGYMFLGVGVGAFMPAMFHLMTHAFFKALMFLGSGSVIHAMHEEQDIRKMGGLMKVMPITGGTFFIGWWAIIGLPPMSGFFSKDEILWYSFASSHGSKILWFIGAVAAAMTAFYMTRLLCLTFFGKSRVPSDVHPHESPASMTFPLVVLGVLSAVGGFIGIPHIIGEILPGHPPNVLAHWLGDSLVKVETLKDAHVLEWALMGTSVAIAGISSYFAYYCYILNPGIPEAFVNRFKGLHNLVSNKYFVDEVYFCKDH